MRCPHIDIEVVPALPSIEAGVEFFKTLIVGKSKIILTFFLCRWKLQNQSRSFSVRSLIQL
jgi:hypothetical protein